MRIVSLLFGLAVLGLWWFTQHPPTPPPNIPDPVLAAALREALNIRADQPITAQVLETVTELNLSDRADHISDLTGLEHCVHLKRLQLQSLAPAGSSGFSGHLTSIAPLAACRELEAIDLTGQPIHDFTPLVALPNLTTVEFDSYGEPTASLPGYDTLSGREVLNDREFRAKR